MVAEMTGRGPSAVVSRLARLRHVRESDLHGCGRFGGGLVPELADCAVLVDCVFFVTDDLSERDAGERNRQGDDPGTPARAPRYEPRMHGSALDHQKSERSRDNPSAQGLRPAGTRSSVCAPTLTMTCPAQ